VDIPKDIQFKSGIYENLKDTIQTSYKPNLVGDDRAIRHAVAMMLSAKKPVLYSGGGVINSGPRACALLRELASLTGFPLTSTLTGLGAYPASGPAWLGMLGMHGTYEANLAMHDCDVMVAIGSRFDDRITGRTDAFSPNSKKIHIDIDASSFNKNIRIDVPIQGDVAHVLEAMIRIWKETAGNHDTAKLQPWWGEIARWRAKKSLAYRHSRDVIMPQTAIERLYQLTKHRETFITTEVGQHQMWAAQYYGFDEPFHWMTSGGLGTMGYGFPAALGVQMAHRDALVVCIAGDASIQMNIQELSTAIQHDLPVKVMILNNQYMGMVRQWQQLLHGNRLAHSYTEAMPDFVKLAEAYGAEGIRAERPDELDDAITDMISSKKPVLFDCRVSAMANCLPMIPSGKAHNEILLATDVTDEDIGDVIDAKGRALV
jgi:acetolactate synthase-1/2/3 large subunit